jgi:arsenite-transporting ATPase
MKGKKAEGEQGRRGEGETKKPAQAKSHISLSPFLPFSLSPVLLFGGKGGVGKTTAASAAALYLLDHACAQERILIISTDPAHSLSDSLDTKIGDAEVEVARHGKARLFAREIDTAAALEEFKSEHRPTLQKIADRGTLLDEGDINELLDLSLPGMDEVMALFELAELDRSGNYSRIVIDTAPSGHTSRLLRLPELFTGWIAALDRLQEKYRFMVAQLMRGARRREDDVEVFLRDMRDRIARLREMLYDPLRAAFTLVTIPEAMAVEETSRYHEMLKGEGVPVTDLIINRVERAHEGCRYCRARASFQKPWLKRISQDFRILRIREVPLLAGEVRGLDSLRQFAALVWPDKKGSGGEREKERNDEVARKQVSNSRLKTTSSPLLPHSSTPLRLLIFGGKGGVGKTTAASATALALAENDTEKRVLVFSTDPAHSLSDSFDERIGQLKRGVAGAQNLDAMEIDPAAWFEGLKRRYRDWIDEVFTTLTAGSRWEIRFEREAMRDIVEFAPPGLDEIAALSHVSNLIDEGHYNIIVLDTAPTGHLVRFLELPDVALSWVRALIKLLLKYKEIARWSQIAEELVALSKSIKRVIALLTDAGECEFIGVAIAERMSLEESLRLTRSLLRLKVPMQQMLINNVVPVRAASKCGFCAARLLGQHRVIEDFRKGFSSTELIIAPQQPREVRGRERLREHIGSWQVLVEDR